MTIGISESMEYPWPLGLLLKSYPMDIPMDIINPKSYPMGSVFLEGNFSSLNLRLGIMNSDDDEPCRA